MLNAVQIARPLEGDFVILSYNWLELKEMNCYMLLAEIKSYGAASPNKPPQNKLKVRSSPSKCNTVTLSSSVPSLLVSMAACAHPPCPAPPSWPPCRDEGEVSSAQPTQAPLRVGKCCVLSVCVYSRPNHPSALSQQLNKAKAGPMSSDCGSAAKCSTFLDVAMHQSQCPLTVW